MSFLAPGPGFSPPAIVPTITRLVSRSGFARCTTPAKRRRRLRIVVSTLSHCAFLRALAYDMHAVVGALLAMEAKNLKEELAMRAVERSEVLPAESPRNTHIAASPSPRR